MSLRTAAQQALEALEQIRTPLRINTALDAYDVSKAIAALRTALAEPEQTFMAEYKHRTYGYYQDADGKMQLGEVPQRKPLTDKEIRDIAKQYALGLAFPYNGPTTPELFARAIERAHGIGGEA
jgi:hypothetical protein